MFWSTESFPLDGHGKEWHYDSEKGRVFRWRGPYETPGYVENPKMCLMPYYWQMQWKEDGDWLPIRTLTELPGMG